MEIKNAVITDTSLCQDDHGILTAWIHLDYGVSGQGFGGYALYLPKSYANHDSKNFAGHFIWRVLEIVGVNDWSKLKGKTVRVKADYERVEAIGNIIKDEWFNPSAEFESMKSSC